MSWPIVELYTLGEISAGGTPSRSKHQYWGKGYKWLSIKDYKDFDLVTTTKEKITEKGLAKSSAKLFPKGTVIISIFATLGRVGVLGEAMATNQAIAGIRCNDKVDKTFLMYCLKSKLANIEQQSGGVAQKNINLSILKGLKIPLPPLPVQKQIAAVLEKADTLRGQCQQMEQELNTLARSVFLELFGDPAKNSKNWPMGIIGDCCASVNYGTSDKADVEKGEYPVLRMNNITYEGRWNFSSLKYLDLDEKSVGKYLARSGDILFNRTNSKKLVGKTAVYREREPMAFAGYLVRARVNDKAVPEYISALMNSRYGKQTLLNMCKSIVGMANINAKEFQKIKLPIPPIELQQKFQKVTFALDEKFLELRDHFKEYDDLFNSLMQLAFKGELELKDVA